MAAVTHSEIERMFPGIQNHTVLEILALKLSIAELEAACLLLQDADEGLVDIKQRSGDRINRLLDILTKSEVRPLDDPDL